MSEHLPDVQLTDEQADRAEQLLHGSILRLAGPERASRLIVQLQDRVAELERHLTKADIERAWAIGKLREAGVMYCCDINAAHPGKHRGGCPSETTEAWPGQAKYKPGPGGNNI